MAKHVGFSRRFFHSFVAPSSSLVTSFNNPSFFPSNARSGLPLPAKKVQDDRVRDVLGSELRQETREWYSGFGTDRVIVRFKKRMRRLFDALEAGDMVYDHKG